MITCLFILVISDCLILFASTFSRLIKQHHISKITTKDTPTVLIIIIKTHTTIMTVFSFIAEPSRVNDEPAYKS